MARVRRDLPVVSRQFTSVDEIDRAIGKLKRRMNEVDAVDARAAIQDGDGQIAVVTSAIRETIREAFGNDSSEFREHQYLDIWSGPMGVNMSREAVLAGREAGKKEVTAILRGLIARVEEKREDLPGASASAPSDPIKAAWTILHPKVRSTAQQRFDSAQFADAVEAVMKELTHTVRELVKQRGGDELDGVSLMQTAFSPNKPIIVLADQRTQSGKDMQRGYMDMFAGAISAIRNPKAHSNVVITRERALHLLFVASTLWYTLDERP